MENIIIITGPTASGKSNVALEIARELSGEIINADSVQVYRGFDIGSAKPLPEDLNKVPHHLFSVVEPDEDWNAGVFIKRAAPVIFDITKRGKIPVITGGTGLYIRSLICGLALTSEIPESVKKQVREIEEVQGVSGLREKLQELDPKAVKNLEPNDRSRLARALSVALTEGQPLSEIQSSHRNENRHYRALVVVLLPERELLYEKINKRVDQMLELGLVNEVRELSQRYPREIRGFTAIGYNQVIEYLEGKYGELEMAENIKQATRHFAKRQLTWWRNQPQSLNWKILKPDKLDDDLISKISYAYELFTSGKEEFEGVGPFTTFFTE